jgi:hypothetical protein
MLLKKYVHPITFISCFVFRFHDTSRSFFGWRRTPRLACSLERDFILLCSFHTLGHAGEISRRPKKRFVALSLKLKVQVPS